jgi:uncharacterized protein (TIGR03083 family)
MDHAAAYERSYKRTRELLSDDVANVPVPTTPGWTVKDVVAHQAGFFTAYASGEGQAAFSDGWADRQVEQRGDRSLEECVAEWDSLMKEHGDMFESPLGRVAVADVLAHEQDIRNALGKPGARDDENIVPSIEMALSFLEPKAKEGNLPTLRIVTDDLDKKIGDGEPAATLRTSTFELFRTLHGRRTLDQMRRMEWEGDPGPWLESLFIFGPTEEEVER